MSDPKDQKKAVIQVVLDHAEGRSVVRVERVLRSRPLETKTILELEFTDSDRAEAEYFSIVEHPYPQRNSFPRSALRVPQEYVTCPGKAEPDGTLKNYVVPGTLQTYTRRGFEVKMAPYIESGKMLWVSANLINLDGQVANIAFGRSPWAALCVLSLFTRRWHSFQVTGDIRTSKVKSSDLPAGVILSVPTDAGCPETLQGHPEIISGPKTVS